VGKLEDLDPKRRRFVEEYAIDWNATQAAIRAGYSPKSARTDGPRMLSNAVVQGAIAELMQSMADRCRVSGEHILDETAKIAFVNMMDYMRIGQDGEPFVDLSACTRAQAAGLLSFEVHDYKEGRGEDSRDIRKVVIKLNPAKFNALVKLGERLGLWKPEGAGEDVALQAQIAADEHLRIENMAEIAQRYLTKPKAKIEKAKEKVG